MIDFNNSSKAIYLQIADDICDKILTGTFVPDERIPSTTNVDSASLPPLTPVSE